MTATAASLAHHGAGVTEKAAQRRAARWAESLEAKVLRAVVEAGEEGLTALEAREKLGLPVERHYSVAPRLSALKNRELIQVGPGQREHFQTYVATDAGRRAAGAL